MNTSASSAPKQQSMFGTEDLTDLVESARRALESEDRYLANCFATRHWKNTEQGICACWNERYYQFFIWRELMSSFRWRPQLEWKQYDLAFFDNESDAGTPVAALQMKGWASYSGTTELPGIRKDIEGLRVLRIPGVMLIFTAQLTNEAADNFRSLAEQLGINRTDMRTASFRISTEEQGDWEFALIAFLV